MHEFSSPNFVVNLLLCYYFYIGLFFSLIFGFFANNMFWNKDTRSQLKKDHGNWGIFRQIWFNFIGAAAGWLSFYLFYATVRDFGLEKLTFNHFLLLIIGVIGIAGLLPAALMGLIKSLEGLFKFLIDKAKS